MSMKTFENLKETLCTELEEISRKAKITAGDLETAHKLTGTIKNIEEIIMFDDAGYSEARDGRRDYNRDSSYANRRRDSLGRYARDDGRDGGNYSRDGGGYSRADGRGRIMEQLEMMMEDADSEKERDAIRRFKREMQNI